MDKVTNEKTIGSRIMNLRKDKRYSREQLAELSGISTSFLYEIEIDKKGFSANTLMNLCSALEVSSDYILYGKRKSDYEYEIAEIVGKFEPARLKKVEELLEITYELIHDL